MGAAAVGQLVDAVELGGGQRDRRRIEPDIAIAVGLDHCTRVPRIGLQMEDTRGMGVEHRVFADLCERGQTHHRAGPIRALRARLESDERLPVGGRRGGVRVGLLRGDRVGIRMRIHPARSIEPARINLRPVLRPTPGHEGGPAQIADLLDRLSARQAMRQLDQRALGVAVDEEIRLRIHQDGAADLLGPMIVVGDPSQARLDAADDDGHALECLARALGIDGHRTVGAATRGTVRRVGIVRAQTPIGGVAIHHRVHVPGGDAEKEVRLSETSEILDRGPVRLGDDADTKALRLEQSPDDRHPERGVIDVGIPRHDHDIAAVPAEQIHLGARHGQLRGGPQLVGPMLAVGEDIGCSHHPGSGR